MTFSLVILPVLLFISGCCGLDFHYHDSLQTERYLLDINTTFPDITHLYSIGQSVQGRELWVMAVGSNPRQHTEGIPEFKYVANMHGNEVVGRVLLLQLIDHLVQGHRDNDPGLSRLLNSARIHIMPSMNPDGFEASDTHCVYSQGRFNHNGVDLNRNFPGFFAGHRLRRQGGEGRELEVQAMMGWLNTESFVLSANLHGGALVVSYPYDNSNGGVELVGRASVTPDNDVFVYLAKVFSYSHASMHRGNRCRDNLAFPDGITNGYQWYPLSGGMQDYNYIWAQCLELTLELSCCKYPPANELPALWKENKQALLDYIKQVHLGVKGRVLSWSGLPLEGAVVEVLGRNNLFPFKTDRRGEYYRLLLPGSYTFRVSYPGHDVLRETLSVPYGPDDYSALVHHFRLREATGVAASHAPSSGLSPTPLPWTPANGRGAVSIPRLLWVVGVWFGAGLI